VVFFVQLGLDINPSLCYAEKDKEIGGDPC
jgi:hypothetical protein